MRKEQERYGDRRRKKRKEKNRNRKRRRKKRKRREAEEEEEGQGGGGRWASAKRGACGHDRQLTYASAIPQPPITTEETYNQLITTIMTRRLWAAGGGGRGGRGRPGS